MELISPRVKAPPTAQNIRHKSQAEFCRKFPMISYKRKRTADSVRTEDCSVSGTHTVVAEIVVIKPVTLLICFNSIVTGEG